VRSRSQSKKHLRANSVANERGASRTIQLVVAIGMIAYGALSLYGFLRGLPRLGPVGQWQVKGDLAWVVTLGLSWRDMILMGAVFTGIGYLGLIAGGAALFLRVRRLVPAATVALAAWAALEMISIPGQVVQAFGGARLNSTETDPNIQRVLTMQGPVKTAAYLAGASHGAITALVLIVLVLFIRRAARRWVEVQPRGKA